MPTFADFQTQVRLRLQDAATKLATADRDELIKQAIQQRYSKDRARELVADVSGDGTSDLPVPANFEEGFSVARAIEYPIGDVPPTFVEDDAWIFYRLPPSGTLKVRLLSARPAASEFVRVTFTARHLSDGSTVRNADFEAVADYAAALSFEALAAVYTQSGDASIAADAVNYRTKSQEYLALAKTLRRRYFQHMGIDEDLAGSAGAGPAVATGELDQELGPGGDRLTHPKHSR